MSLFDETRDLRLAVIQLEAPSGKPERNMAQAEDLVRQAAREHDPDMILLPDACTGALMPGRVTGAAAQRDAGPFYGMLRSLAREFGCWLGGGYLALRGDSTRCTYVLAEPDGATHLHDRGAIALWESALIAAGKDDGFCSTPLMPLGLASGLEFAQPDTVMRLKGLVRMVVGGTCLFSSPGPAWWPTDRFGIPEASAAALAPGLARSVGVPVAVAQQAGRADGAGLPIPGLSWSVVMPGGSAIVDRDGTVLAAMSARDGTGYVAAAVRLGAPPPFETAPDTHELVRPPMPMRVLSSLMGVGGRMALKLTGGAGIDACGTDALDPAGGEPLMAYNPSDRPRSERIECLPLAPASSNGSAPAATAVGTRTNVNGR